MFIHTYTYKHTHIYSYIQTYKHTDTLMYTYTNTYIHTHTHIHADLFFINTEQRLFSKGNTIDVVKMDFRKITYFYSYFLIRKILADSQECDNLFLYYHRNFLL